MQTQLDSLRNILDNGSLSYDGRNGGTISVYGTLHRYPAEQGAPIPTTKLVNDRTVSLELEWFVTGNVDNYWLVKRGVKIWNRWDCKLASLDTILERLADTIDYYSPHTSLKSKLLAMTDYRVAITHDSKLDVARAFAIEHSVNIKSGELGPVYGAMFRKWPCNDGGTVDQLTQLDNNLKNLPMSRRHVISLWNPDLLPDEAKSHIENIDAGKQVLPPCHMSQQVMIEELTINEIVDYNELNLTLTQAEQEGMWTLLDGLWNSADLLMRSRVLSYLTGEPLSVVAMRERKEPTVKLILGDLEVVDYYQIRSELDIDFRRQTLSKWQGEGIKTHKVHLQFYMRSNDEPIGRPFNVFSYYLLKEIIANVHNFVPGDLIQTTGVAHIYANQVDAVCEQLSRTPTKLPTLEWKRKLKSITDFKHDDYILHDYNPQPFIDTPVSA